MDKHSRKEKVGKESGKQTKNLFGNDEHLVKAIAFFVLGALLLAAGAITRIAFLGLFGGGCLLLGLERLNRRSAEKHGDVVSDLRADEARNREKK